MDIKVEYMTYAINKISVDKLHNMTKIDKELLEKFQEHKSDYDISKHFWTLTLKQAHDLTVAGRNQKAYYDSKQLEYAKGILEDIKQSQTDTEYFFKNDGKVLCNKDTYNLWSAYSHENNGQRFYGIYADVVGQLDSRNASDEEITRNIAEVLKYGSFVKVNRNELKTTETGLLVGSKIYVL